MIVLGVHDGHNSGCTLVINGIVISSILEERLTKNKNEVGFPKKSILECMRINKLDFKYIDYVVYSSLYMHSKEKLKQIVNNYSANYLDQIKEKKLIKLKYKSNFEKQKILRIKIIKNLFNISTNKIFFLDHHLCHVAASYYLSDIDKSKKILGISFDGSGDNSSGKVFICNNGNFTEISSTSRHASLGKIYSRVTYLLGMKPWEHEYKVMGLAPYSNPKYTGNIINSTFKKLIKVNEAKLTLIRKTKLSMNYCYEYLCQNLSRQRFDNVSGAIQKFTEQILIKFVKASIKKTKIPNLVLGGGVFMNVKANMLITKLKEVKKIFFMPSCGDESLSMGAALYFYYLKSGDKDLNKSKINNLYFGHEFSKLEEEKVIKKKFKDKSLFKIIKTNLNKNTAKLISNGKVIGRCVGKAEWGARALGNRSILARPDNYLIVDKINQMIKQRDFWMPFAPSILEQHAFKFFEIGSKNHPYFMTLAYQTKNNKFAKLLSAASHIRDKTIRPQLVNKKVNNQYYELINEFYKLTKIPALLNTSFNLHGLPIVNSPSDAANVFLKSGLNGLLLNNFLVLKKF